MQKLSGFTLIELLVTITVLSILLALGVPSFNDFIKNNRIVAQANGLVADIHLARSEAVKRGAGSAICASDDQTTCSGDASGWASGWIVFSDINGDGAPDTGTGACLTTEDCLLRTNDGLSENNIMTATGNNLRFIPNGFTSNGPITYTLTSANCEYQQSREIKITAQGHSLVTEQDCP